MADARARRAATVCAQAGLCPTPSVTQPLAPPIWQTAAFAYPDLETMEAIIAGELPGFVYARYGLPNHRQLEQALAALEGGEDAVVTASGMSAIAATLFALSAPGQRVVADAHVYRGTRLLLEEDLARFGVAVQFVDCGQLEAVERALAVPARLLWVDTLTNPTLRVRDLPRLAALARQSGALLVVDNTFATPVHCRPLEQGAQLVVHSTTKMLGGHHDASGGAVIGPAELVASVRRQVVRFGGRGGAFDAWLVLRGVATLPLRTTRSSTTALELAQRLAAHPSVQRVSYPGLPSHPDWSVAERLFTGGYGAVVAFEVTGGAAAVRRFLRGLALVRFAETLGGTVTTVVHPATTSHRVLAPSERAALGIGDGLLRLSVGMEDPEDLWRDLERALTASQH
ncbi:MAG: aminotransferase class I/II-fold pyridoxal phosphate-dependent enzyme [Thermomicrobium sp.]|nr:aminotransferase class I/II-fold pyridoxal phosphate-dependent enzyme [Thermomicrobium sp.]MDW8059349.1 aminotransferase class I/II-fold pyridoxal phosphate-dependent enzyme [Thermomicrobium sp.]